MELFRQHSSPRQHARQTSFQNNTTSARFRTSLIVAFVVMVGGDSVDDGVWILDIHCTCRNMRCVMTWLRPCIPSYACTAGAHPLVAPLPHVGKALAHVVHLPHARGATTPTGGRIVLGMQWKICFREQTSHMPMRIKHGFCVSPTLSQL